MDVVRIMSKIAVIIDNLFEDVEYLKPAAAFKRAGHNLTHIGLKKGKTVKGEHQGTKVRIEKAVEDVSVDEFDALFIPGGYSPDKLRANDQAVKFVKKFVKTDKPIFAICHAPQLLITAKSLEGRKMTGYKSIIQDIKNAGAEYIDQEVVIDKNLISSRNPGDIPAFIKATLKKLEKT
jgi:deglycase